MGLSDHAFELLVWIDQETFHQQDNNGFQYRISKEHIKHHFPGMIVGIYIDELVKAKKITNFLWNDRTRDGYYVTTKGHFVASYYKSMKEGSTCLQV